MKLRNRGFTLLEALVAMAIFSFIGVAAYNLLASTGRLKESGDAGYATLSGMQLALRQIEEDFSQFAPRPVPGRGRDQRPALDASRRTQSLNSRAQDGATPRACPARACNACPGLSTKISASCVVTGSPSIRTIPTRSASACISPRSRPSSCATSMTRASGQTAGHPNPQPASHPSPRRAYRHHREPASNRCLVRSRYALRKPSWAR